MEIIPFLMHTVSFLLLLVEHIPPVTSSYSSTSQCSEFSNYPNQSSCTGRGTSNTADGLGNVLNGNEKYAFFALESVLYLVFVTRTKYEWQPGVLAQIYTHGAVGVLFSFAPGQLSMITLEGCSKVIQLQNNARTVNGLDGLTGAACFTAYNLLDRTVYPLQCNVIPGSDDILVPYQEGPTGNLNTEYKLSGIRSFSVQTNSTANSVNLASRARKNIVPTNVMIQQIPFSSMVYVTEPGSTASSDCTLESTVGVGMVAGGVVGGDANMAANLNFTDVCSILGIFAMQLSNSPVVLFIILKIVIYSPKEGVFAFLVGFTNSRITSSYVNALLSGCKN